MFHRVAARAGAVLPLVAAATWCSAQPSEDLGRYYGFDPMRIIVVDDGCGPLTIADFNGDGRPDLAIVNNRKSRIEMHYLRASVRSDVATERQMRANALPPNPWYDREDISVAHRVAALLPYDIDDDADLDLVYAGSNPSEIVILEQTEPTRFVPGARRRVRSLAAHSSAFAIADVVGDESEELITIVDERLNIFPIENERFGDPEPLGSPGPVGFFVNDFNGDDLHDLLGIIPDNATPVRLWLQNQDPRIVTKSGLLAAEYRFELPRLREIEPVPFPDRDSTSLAVLEAATRRMVGFDLVERDIETETGGEREVQAAVSAFSDKSSKDRSVVVVDLDNDGREDLLATDSGANTLVWYRQASKVGLVAGEAFSAFKSPASVAVGQWDGEGSPEVFVLSEEEKTAGVAFFDSKTNRLGFPTPIQVETPGASPAAIAYVELDGAGTLAMIVKKRRDNILELHNAGSEGDVTTVPLTDVSRPPQSMLGADADQDGKTDILLFTPSEPMVMALAGDNGEWEVLTDKQMRNFGLVQAAGPDNTALVDINGDGSEELLLADQNFVRACAYNRETGWRVVDQITVPETGTNLAGLAVLSTNGTTQVVASDKGNERLLLIGEEANRGWKVTDRLRLLGFPLGAVHAGRFAGDDQPTLLAIGDDAFALLRLAGQRPELEQFAAYRSDNEDRLEHDIEVGDLNSDGFVDLVVLDAAEQMCQIFTFSAARKLHLATEFEVFQSRLFSGGQTRQFEPRGCTVADATGDDADDIILTIHDRVIVYPQMNRDGDE